MDYLMHYERKYWRNNPDTPFATLLNAIEAYCHPEAYDEAYDDLIERTRNPEDVEMQRFKEELRTAIGDPGRIPKGALFHAASYDDGSDEKFLRRLWRDLYGDEPVGPPYPVP